MRFLFGLWEKVSAQICRTVVEAWLCVIVNSTAGAVFLPCGQFYFKR
jgi:hypothetical protein